MYTIIKPLFGTVFSFPRDPVFLCPGSQRPVVHLFCMDVGSVDTQDPVCQGFL